MDTRKEVKKVAENDIEMLREKAKCVIMKLPEQECAKLLAELKAEGKYVK